MTNSEIIFIKTLDKIILYILLSEGIVEKMNNKENIIDFNIILLLFNDILNRRKKCLKNLVLELLMHTNNMIR